MNKTKENPMEIGKCERCEEMAELVVTTIEQRFFGEALTHCQNCSDDLSQEAQERAFEAYWRG
jgi:hypothetical protein